MSTICFRVKYLERVFIGPDIVVSVDYAKGRAVKMWVEAPEGVRVRRELSRLEEKKASGASQVEGG